LASAPCRDKRIHTHQPIRLGCEQPHATPQLVDEEAPVGSFSADIIASDGGRIIVIENQLESTDHSHLGQIITYAAGLDAAVVVWISAKMRDEHRQAIDWLNRHTSDDLDFFGLEVEVFKINESLPAPHFRIVAAPNSWSKRERLIRSRNATTSPKQETYREFFQELIDVLREKHRFTNAKVGLPQSWYTFPTGRSGISYNISYVSGGRLRAEVYIATNDPDRNKEIFDVLHTSCDEINAAFGIDLEWEPLDTKKKACRIANYKFDTSIEDPAQAENLAWCVQQLLQFKSVFGDRLLSI